MALRLEQVAVAVGDEVIDEYGRITGVLVSFISGVEGYVQAIEVKIADRGLERVPGDRVKFKDGRLVIVPEWKYNALKVIEALDRAYRRRKALENIASQGDIPGDVIDGMKRKLTEEIKRLKVEAEKAKSMIKDRISQIEDENLHVASAIANLQMLYFSGEVSEKGYTQGMNNLRKLKRALADEKSDAKKTLDKLEKTLEAASAPTAVEKPSGKPKEQVKHEPAPQAVRAPSKVDEGSLVVKIEEA